MDGKHAGLERSRRIAQPGIIESSAQSSEIRCRVVLSSIGQCSFVIERSICPLDSAHCHWAVLRYFAECPKKLFCWEFFKLWFLHVPGWRVVFTKVVSWKTGFVCYWNSVYISLDFVFNSKNELFGWDGFFPEMCHVPWHALGSLLGVLFQSVFFQTFFEAQNVWSWSLNIASVVCSSPFACCLSNLRASHGSDCMTMMVNNFQTLESLNVTSQALGSIKSFETNPGRCHFIDV